MRRAWTAAAAALCALASRPASAVGTLSSGADSPLEQRVALSIGPDRTTLWTSVRIDARGGPVGIVAPAAPGAALDWSSSAWFEALESSTAPRILAPALTCRGEPPAASLDVVGETGHEVTLPAGAVAVLADAAAVAAWAAENGLAIPPALAEALAGFTGQRFVAARFDAPAGTALTPTLRIVSPALAPELPLVLTRAGEEDLLVTTWVLGRGRAHLDGAPVAAINLSQLTFNARTGESGYADARAEALAGAGRNATLIEAASHGALIGGTPLGNGESIDGLADAYFERASAYGDGLPDAGTCLAQATTALAGAPPVAASCPRAALGVVDGTPSCTEAVGAGETDPETLRCGPGADDLAVALSGQAPFEAWLTRQSLVLPAGGGGDRLGVSLPGGAEVSPAVTAGTLICQVPVRRVPSSGCSCGGTEETVVIGFLDFLVEDETDEPPESYEQEEDCEGDPSDTRASDSSSESSSDDGGCSGDSSDTGDGGSGGSDASSSSSSGSGGDSSSDDGCGSDTGGSDSSDDGCDCGSGGSGGDSGGSGSSCAVSAPKRRGHLRLSPLALGALLVVAPLRRALRPKRRAGASRRGGGEARKG